MDVSISKAGKRDAVDCDLKGVLSRKRVHFGTGTNRNDPPSRDCHGFGLGMRPIQGEDLTDKNGVRGRRLRVDRNCCRGDRQ